jgi:hypothetical protein
MDQARIYIALDLHRAGKLIEAEELIRQVKASTSPLLSSYCEDELGRIEAMNGNPVAALEAYARSSALMETRPIPWMSRLSVSVETGMRKEAEDAAQELNQHVPSDHADLKEFCCAVHSRVARHSVRISKQSRTMARALLQDFGDTAAGGILHAFF